MTKVVEGECVPALKRDGSYAKGGNAYSKMHKALEEREGPRPFSKAVCRHLCKNDSQAHKRENGFVCTAHTTWGTYSENNMDRSPEDRAKGGRASGKISGKITGKLWGPVWANSPHHPNKVEVTCPHCGMTGKKPPMTRWHFDNCKLKSISSLCSVPPLKAHHVKFWSKKWLWYSMSDSFLKLKWSRHLARVHPGQKMPKNICY